MINVGPFFDAIAEILKCDHSNDRTAGIISNCGSVPFNVSFLFYENSFTSFKFAHQLFLQHPDGVILAVKFMF